MKKVPTIIGILFVVLVVVPLIAGAIGGVALDVVSMLYVAAIIALPFVLVGLLVHRLRKNKTHAAEAAGPDIQQQEPQQVRASVAQPRQTVKVAKSTVVPAVEESDSLDIDVDDDDIAYRYTNVGVFVPYTEVFGHPALVEGAVVSFRQEPENRHDPHAVAVVIGRKRIGYLFKGKLQDMANDWLDRGESVAGRVIRVDPGSVDAKSNGVRINLYFYN